jgi:hypothetical protein
MPCVFVRYCCCCRDKGGYNRELAPLGLGKFATQGDLLRADVQAAIAQAHSSSEERCRGLLQAWLKRVRVKGKRLTEEWCAWCCALFNCLLVITLDSFLKWCVSTKYDVHTTLAR